MNGFNLSDITDAKFGNVQVSELYFGSTKIWPSITNEYFYVETTHNTGGYDDYLTLSLLCNSYDERTGYGDPQTLYYSYDQIHWNIADDYVYPPTGESGSRIIGQHSGVVCYYYVKNKIIPYNNNDKIYLKGNLSPHVTSTTSQDVTVQFDTGVIINLRASYLVNVQYGSFLNNNFNIGGNICSLLYGDIDHNTIPNDYTYVFSKLIWGSSALIDASNLILPNNVTENCYYEMFFGSPLLTAAPALPATTLAPYCYNHMFGDCPSLTTAPALPATTLADHCYSSMFSVCTSLTLAPALPATTLATYCYNNMFFECSSLTTAPALPATTLADYCYSSMFSGCTSLTLAPALPATTLANYCYQYMFFECSSLTTAPALPATTLANSCYGSMFRGCTSLTTAPALPATTLANSCYGSMFNSCTLLNYVKCLATDMSATSCLNNWLQNVSATGTFVKDVNTTWPSGTSGIPTGWTIQNAS